MDRVFRAWSHGPIAWVHGIMLGAPDADEVCSRQLGSKKRKEKESPGSQYLLPSTTSYLMFLPVVVRAGGQAFNLAHGRGSLRNTHGPKYNVIRRERDETMLSSVPALQSNGGGKARAQGGHPHPLLRPLSRNCNFCDLQSALTDAESKQKLFEILSF